MKALIIAFLCLVAVLPVSCGNCIHGQAIGDQCSCEPFFAGPTCSIACPGRLVSSDNVSCSDTGCYGQTAEGCGAGCVYRESDGACLGESSCVASVCSTHGQCDWGSSGSGKCSTCDENFYGDDCAAFCSPVWCENTHGIPGLVCNAADGSCVCPHDNVSGHFGTLDHLCRDCEEGWYGPSCLWPCNCSGHGSCAQLSGSCTCYADDVRGYWAGEQCDRCDPRYFGDICNSANMLLTPTASVQMLWDSVNLENDPSSKAQLSQQPARSTFRINDHNQFVATRGPAAACGEATASDGLVQTGTAVSFHACTVWDSTEGSHDAVLRLLVVNDTNSSEWHVLTVRQNENSGPNGTCTFVEEDDTIIGSTTSTPSHVVGAAFSREKVWFVVGSTGTIWTPTNSSFEALPRTFQLVSMQVDDENSLLLLAGSDASGSWKTYYYNYTNSSAEGTLVERIEIIAENLVSDFTTAADLLYLGSKQFAFVLFSSMSLTINVTVVTADMNGGFCVSASLAISTLLETETVSLIWYPQQDLLYLAASGPSTSPATVLATLHYEATNTSDGTERVGEGRTSINLSLIALQLTASPFASANEAVLSLHVNWALLFAQLWLPASGTVAVVAYTTYVVDNVVPNITHRYGGAPLTLTGNFLPSSALCVFDGNVTMKATFINSSAVTCTASPYNGSIRCDGSAIGVSTALSPFLATAASAVNLSRFPTLHLTHAVAGQGSYTSVAAGGPVHVYGQGFGDYTVGIVCRFQDAAGMDALSEATYVSSDTVNCAVPSSVTRPTSGETGTVALSYGALVFSNKVPFTFVGPAYQLQVVNPTGTRVFSAKFLALPIIVVQVVDNESHPLYELDDEELESTVEGRVDGNRVVMVSAEWFNSTRKEVSRYINPYESLIVLAYSNKTIEGQTRFTAYLQYPLVGEGLLKLSSDGLLPGYFEYSVDEGLPTQLSVVVQPPDLIRNSEVSFSRQPVLVFLDDSGNSVRNETATRDVTVTATFFNGTESVYNSATPTTESYIPFYGVFPQGAFGSRYVVYFTSSGMKSVVSQTMSLASCASDEYGEYGGLACLPCPAHATCNGSYSFNASAGYWKAGDFAYTMYACPRPQTCEGTRCIRGYTGVLCSVCSNGYGKSGNLCVRCFSSAANVILVILLILALLVAVFLVVFFLFQSLGPYRVPMNAIRLFLDFIQIASVVIAPLSEMPDFVDRFSVFLRAFATGDILTLEPFSCLFKLDAHTSFIIAVVSPLVICLLMQGILFYAEYLYERYLQKLDRQDRFNRSLAPFKSQEEYFARIARLGLDEEPTLGSGVSASLEDLEQQKRKVRMVYTLLEKNTIAVTTMSQMPPSKQRLNALQALFNEQDDLHEFLERYQAYVSKEHGKRSSRRARRVKGRSRVTEDSAASECDSSVQAEGSAASSSTALASALQAAEKTADAGGGKAWSATPNGAQLLRSGAPQNRLPAADGSRRATSTPVDGTSMSADSSNASARNMPLTSMAMGHGLDPRFPPVTNTRLALFGVDEPPFQPSRTNLETFSHRLTAVKETVTARTTKEKPVLFMWPKQTQNLLQPPLIIAGYFYVAVLRYCFSLVECRTINSSVTASEDVQRVLFADSSVKCGTSKHGRYRKGGIIVGSLFGAGYPLLLLLVLAVKPQIHAMDRERTRMSFECISGMHSGRCWWEIVTHLRKFLVVLLFTLLSSKHMASLIAFWSLVVVALIESWVSPYSSRVTQRVDRLQQALLLAILFLQLLPYLYDPSKSSRAIATTGGVLTVVCTCLGAAIALVVCAVLLLLPPQTIHSLTQRWRKAIAVVALGSRSLRARNTAWSSDAARVPFSFKRSNSAVVRSETVLAIERRNVDPAVTRAEEQSAGLRVTRSVQMSSGLHSLLPSAFSAGKMATVRTTDLLLDFVETHTVQLGPRPPVAGGGLSFHDMELEVAEAHGVVTEHGQQLDRLIQLLQKSLERQRK